MKAPLHFYPIWTFLRETRIAANKSEQKLTAADNPFSWGFETIIFIILK
jgi:hypothetical protein